MFIPLNLAIVGCEPLPVYTCPVQLARQPWLHTVFALHRNEARPVVLQHLMPDHPSKALIDAVDYTSNVVGRLHAAQNARRNQHQ